MVSIRCKLMMKEGLKKIDFPSESPPFNFKSIKQRLNFIKKIGKR